MNLLNSVGRTVKHKGIYFVSVTCTKDQQPSKLFKRQRRLMSSTD